MISNIQTIGIAVILANIVSVGDLIFSFWKHATINRKKQLILMIIQCVLCCISYFLLKTYTSLATCLFAILKYFYMLKVHKEEKVKLTHIENILLNVPYFIFAWIFFYNDGWLGVFYAITGALDDSRFVMKKDSDKQILSIVTQLAYAVYHVCILDFVKALKQIINCGINVINYQRIKAHGEDYFYHKMRDEISKDGEEDA